MPPIFTPEAKTDAKFYVECRPLSVLYSSGIEAVRIFIEHKPATHKYFKKNTFCDKILHKTVLHGDLAVLSTRTLMRGAEPAVRLVRA